MKSNIKRKFLPIYAERIRHFRQLSELTQAQLAEKSDMTTENINKIENGKVSPPIETLNKIAEALNIQTFQFFTEQHDDCFKQMSDDQMAVWEMIQESPPKVVFAVRTLLEAMEEKL